MKNKPAISVLIPVHNCEFSLNRALDSVKNQTFCDYEVVVVLNLCTDESEKIVESYRKEFPLTILKCEEPGIVPTLNTGIPYCTGEMIARQDGDDYWYPDKLQKQYDFLKKNPNIDILGTQINMVERVGNEYAQVNKVLPHPLENNDIKMKLLNGSNSIAHPSVLFRKKILLKSGGYEDTYRFAEDYYLWLKCIRWYNFANLEEVLIDYTISKNPEYNPNIPKFACLNMIQILKQQGILR